MAKINLGKVVPEKGVDYFTDAEIAAFKAQVEADIDARLDTDEANITTNANNIDSNTSAISALDTRMTSAEGNISTNAGDISTISGKVSTLENDMTSAKADILTNAGDINTINQQQTIQDNAIAANTTALEALSNIPTKVSTLEASQIVQDAKILELEEENESLRHDLNTSTLDSTDEISDNVALENTVNARFKKLVPLGKTDQFTTTGKNLLTSLNSLDTQTAYGITYTPVYKDGLLQYINANGTATATANYYIVNEGTSYRKAISAGTYILSGCPTDGGVATYRITIGITGVNEYTDSGSGRTLEVSEDNTYYLKLTVTNGVTVNNLRFYPMLRLASITDDTYEPYTNGASPNPSYPQEIKNVEGKNILIDIATTSNKKGIDFTVNADGTILANGTNDGTGNSQLYLQNTGITNAQIFEKGTYKITGCPANGNTNTYRIAVQTSNFTVLAVDIGNGASFTLEEDAKLNISIVIQSGLSISNLLFKPMISKESGEYVPYNSIGFKVENKNLLPNNLTWAYGYVSSVGNWISDGTHKNCFSDYFYFKAGIYTISYETPTNIIGIAKYDMNKTFVDREQSISQSPTKIKTFTLNQDGYIRISHYDDTGTQVLENINSEKNMIEKGSTSTDYIPHQEQILPFTLDEGQYLAEGGYLADDGIHNIMGKIVFDGSSDENWQTTNKTYYIGIADKRSNTTLDNNNIISNYFKETVQFESTALINIGEMTEAYYTSGNQRVFFNYDDAVGGIENFKTWLSTHNLILLYELAEESITEYTPTQVTQWKEIKKAMTYKGTTHISGIGSINPNIEAIGIKDIRTLQNEIDNLDSRLSLLE